MIVDVTVLVIVRVVRDVTVVGTVVRDVTAGGSVSVVGTREVIVVGEATGSVVVTVSVVVSR